MAIISLINYGFELVFVDIECSITNGLPSLTIVGLASKSVDEAKEKIRAALKASSFAMTRKRIVINLAPADPPKDTTNLDVSIALSATDNQIDRSKVQNNLYIGELGLDGSIRGVRGLLGRLFGINVKNSNKIYIPKTNTSQARLLNLPNIYPVGNLKSLIEHMNGNTTIELLEAEPLCIEEAPEEDESCIDFSDIQGQEVAKRALLIAAAGGHNILLLGPPGTGKSMPAKAFMNLLPH